jgi:hypothetical protein
MELKNTPFQLFASTFYPLLIAPLTRLVALCPLQGQFVVVSKRLRSTAYRRPLTRHGKVRDHRIKGDVTIPGRLSAVRIAGMTG